jgi:hypothetical protein
MEIADGFHAQYCVQATSNDYRHDLLSHARIRLTERTFAKKTPECELDNMMTSSMHTRLIALYRHIHHQVVANQGFQICMLLIISTYLNHNRNKNNPR